MQRLENNFSPDYATARMRLQAAAQRLRCTIEAHRIEGEGPKGESLEIDVLTVGNPHPKRVLLLSSGVHGVEAFFGSAVQLAFLESLPKGWRPPADGAVVLLHSLNPYGFAWQRRFNESNIDLNRNFLLRGDRYGGSHPLIGYLQAALGPNANHWFPRPIEVRMLSVALRHGLTTIWQSLPIGQYEYPDWLFFGGTEPSQAYRLVSEHFKRWLSRPESVVHLDFHTGLGKWATYKLLLDSAEQTEHTRWWREHFDHVSPADCVHNNYRPRGAFGVWCQSQFLDCQYRFATAEFGSYAPLRVLKALIWENREHFTNRKMGPEFWKAKRQLMEAFVPQSPRWRRRVVAESLTLIQKAIRATWDSK